MVGRAKVGLDGLLREGSRLWFAQDTPHGQTFLNPRSKV